MHPANIFHERDINQLIQTAISNPFALVIATQDGRPVAAHSPVLLSHTSGSVSLRFHLSRANPVTNALKSGSSALLVFTGPHAYISPDWYGQDDQVPTWNYLSVEAEGPVKALDDAGATQFLDDLSQEHETALAPKPVWTRQKMTPGRFEAMLPGITAFEMAATRFEGIRKLNQNKPASARAGVIAALGATERGVELAAEMRKVES